MTKSGGKAIYLYAITGNIVKKKMRSPGVDGSAAVETLPCGGLVCWVSQVDATEYAENLSRNMEDADWLAVAGARHRRVVAEIARHADMLPVRFGAVFLSQQSLAGHIKKNKRGLSESLKITSGADEWGVKVFATAPAPQVAKADSGRGYLRKKAARRPATGIADPEIEQFVLQLARLAQGMAPAEKVSAGQRQPEWQASFLLRRTSKKQWQQVLDRYVSRWRGRKRIECTGPWPPYSFVIMHAR